MYYIAFTKTGNSLKTYINKDNIKKDYSINLSKRIID